MENYKQVKACELTQQLKKMKIELQEMANETSDILSVDIDIKICGMSVMYIARFTNFQVKLSQEVVSNNIAGLKEKFAAALLEYPSLLRERILKGVINAKKRYHEQS